MLPPLCFSVGIMYFSEALSCGPLEHILMQSFGEEKKVNMPGYTLEENAGVFQLYSL